MTRSTAIAAFWGAFVKRADELAHIRSAEEPVYDELLEELQGIDEGLYFEFSAKPGNRELIITAEGDLALFPLVDEIVAAAPSVDGWKVFALKPQLGFPESVAWEGFRVKIADVVFDPLSDEDGNLGLSLLVPGLRDENVDDAHNALLRAIDHGLGERAFAQAVQYTEVLCLEEPSDDYIPLTELENFIAWRNKQRGS